MIRLSWKARVFVGTLDLTDGEGGRDLFSLEDCPPITTPIHVHLGGD